MNSAILKIGFFLLIFLVTFSSCVKDKDNVKLSPSNNPSNGIDILSIMTRSDFDDIIPEADIYMVANGVAFSNIMPSIEIVGKFFSSGGTEMSVDTFKIGDLLIPVESGLNRHRIYTSYLSESSMSQVMGFYGDRTEFSVSDDVFPDFDTTIYVPKLLYLDNYSHSHGSIDKTQSLTVTWNADTSNHNMVLVAVYYVPRDTSISNTPVLITAKTDDDGSHTFTSSELDDLPVGGNAYVVVARGNQVILYLPGTEKEALINAFSYSLSEELLIVDP